MRDGDPEDIEAVEEHDDEARNDAGDKELADRLFGQHTPDYHQYRRRDQHAQARAAGDAAQCEAAVVAVLLHLR